jgi:hypothetical protein
MHLASVLAALRVAMMTLISGAGMGRVLSRACRQTLVGLQSFGAERQGVTRTLARRRA